MVAQIHKPLEVRASLGRTPSFVTQTDADAYDSGVRRFAKGEEAPASFASRLGWLDARAMRLDAIRNRGNGNESVGA